MIDYFKPWRRKLGVATLMMACAVCGLSLHTERPLLHEFVIPAGQNCEYHVTLCATVIGVSRSDSTPLGSGGTRTEVTPVTTFNQHGLLIPLTLLSGYLLFSKPRKKPMTPTDSLS